MLEVEVKAALGGRAAEAVRRDAEGLGFVPAQTLGETDVYFDGADRDFKKTDEALRLRSCRDLDAGTEETLLTYKGPKLDAASSTRMEYETAVGDRAVMGKLLEALGYRPAFTVRKTRREFRLDGVTLCLDTVEGLGEFLELETLAADGGSREAEVGRLLGLLDRLGIGREQLTRTSYLEMLIAKKRNG